jgi:hypothetical protein
MVAERIGPELGKRSLVVVPFAGGMSELPYIDAGKLLVNDRHRHLVNLARVLSDPHLGLALYRRLRREVFHPDTLAAAQGRCSGREMEFCDEGSLFNSSLGDRRHAALAHLEWAADYAICTWMGRGGRSGTEGEFRQGLPIRYSPNGGGSAQRFHNWVASIPAWRRVLRRCEFATDDALDVIAACHDSARCGIYCDPPWPDVGDKYTHADNYAFQRRIASALSRFTAARVVVRYADHPLIRELYPRDRWTWLTYPSRAQTNDKFDEVLILNGASRVAEVA